MKSKLTETEQVLTLFEQPVLDLNIYLPGQNIENDPNENLYCS